MKRKPWANYVRVATPGPWAPGSLSLDRRAGRYIRPVAGGASICQVTVHRKNWREHARLIAAAPTLLEMLKRAHAGLGLRLNAVDYTRLADAVKAAIDLAEGRIPFPEPDPWRCSACDAMAQEPKAGCNHKEEPEDGE